MSKDKGTTGTTTAAPERAKIELVPVNSSQIHSVGYDEAAGEIEIAFRSRTTESGEGSHYRYPGKTPEQYRDFFNAPSLGTHFGQHIKSGPTLKLQDDGTWEPLTPNTKASSKSLAMLRDLATEQGMIGGDGAAVIGPGWRGTVEAAGGNYEGIAGVAVGDWLGTLTQPQCSEAIEFLKATAPAKPKA